MKKNGGQLAINDKRRVKFRKGKALIFAVIFAMLAFVSVGCVSAATYSVCPSGCDYTSIQAAIDAADPCDTIEVHSGTYNENVNVTKQLILRGVDTGGGKPVADAGGSGSAITLHADGIMLEGFRATGSGSEAGIKVTSKDSTITGNDACNNIYDGIYTYRSSNNNIYLNNFINNTDNAYSCFSTNFWNSTEKITYTYNGSQYTNYLGNYWDDYTGNDTNDDGIGNTSYVIPNENNDNYPLMQLWENYFAPAPYVFDTDAGTYPSIMGTHNGTITPSDNITVSTLYTYPCVRTGGHTKSIELYNETGTLIANGSWNRYIGDYHNITIHNLTGEATYVTLLKNHKYNYTIVTGSYPQIIHEPGKEVTGGTITCTNFTDANGVVHYNCIPAIRLYDLQK